VLDDTSEPGSESGIELLERPEPQGQPGTRIPHAWLERLGSRLSTIDLLQGGFVLLTGPDGARWCEAARAAASAMGVSVAAYRIATDGDLLDLEGTALATFGISSSGTILARPDGFVGWRTDALANSSERTLEESLGRILGQPR
jgi:putative polyketide hydroxylase